MQKGLSTFLNVIKLTDSMIINQVVTTLEKHFILSLHEIAQAYQKSFESALNTIITGLDKQSRSNELSNEFARQIFPDYLEPFASQNLAPGNLAFQQFCTEAIAKCKALIKHKTSLFQSEQTILAHADFVSIITDTASLSITDLILEHLSHHPTTKNLLDDDRLLTFLSYNDLLGQAILLFFENELRQNEQVINTLEALQEQGLWQDLREIKDSLQRLMNRLDLSEQIKPHDEYTHHNNESQLFIRETVDKLNLIPTNHPQYSQLLIMGASSLSSTGALQEAEELLEYALEEAQNDAVESLAAFDLFQVKIRRGNFESALVDLQHAINIDPYRYALHDVDKYPMTNILGAGGMGCVFLCQHKLQKKEVVIKCFWEHRKGPAEEVFKEAFAMADIAGQYVPAPLDYGYVDQVNQERAFFMTEYINGAIDGETWLDQYGKLNLKDGLNVGLQIAEGLQAAHIVGVFHLDLKPANILLKQTEAGLEVRIIDFGLAQVATPLQQQLFTRHRQTQLSVLGQMVFGTLDYAAPEQQGFEQYGEPSSKSDVFAFGATMYRLLTNENPRKFNPKRLAEVPELFELLCDCVEEEPEQRPSLADISTEIKYLEQYVSYPELQTAEKKKLKQISNKRLIKRSEKETEFFSIPKQWKLATLLLTLIIIAFVLFFHSQYNNKKPEPLSSPLTVENNKTTQLSLSKENRKKTQKANSMGQKYYNEKKYIKALEWFRKSAELGNARGQTILGKMYEKGEGITQDYSKAHYWYHQAAQRGDAEGQFKLAAMYYEGKGVKKNYIQAANWYRKSAAQGFGPAQTMLEVIELLYM